MAGWCVTPTSCASLPSLGQVTTLSNLERQGEAERLIIDPNYWAVAGYFGPVPFTEIPVVMSK
jgi:hypothetical protein